MHVNHIIYAYEPKPAGGGKKGGSKNATGAAAATAYVACEQDAISGLLEYFGIENNSDENYNALLNSQNLENVDKLESKTYCLLSFVYKSIVLLNKLNKITDDEVLKVKDITKQLFGIKKEKMDKVKEI